MFVAGGHICFGKDTRIYKSPRMALIMQRLITFVRGKPVISYKPEDLQHLVGYKEDALKVQFGLMQVVMDLVVLFPRSASRDLRTYLPLYKKVGNGCSLGSEQEVAAIAHALENHSLLQKLFRQLGVSPKVMGWWFLAEHGSCGIRKYVDSVGAEVAAGTVECVPTRERLAARYSDPNKEAEYHAVLAWLRSRR